MNEQDLKKLGRQDLLQLLIAQGKEKEAELKKAKEALNSRAIDIENVGSLAEASLKLNGVFQAAEEASKQYLENIALKEKLIKEKYAKKEAELLELETKANEKIEEQLKAALIKADQIEAEAKVRAELYWSEVSERLESFYKEHKALKELIALGGKHEA